LAKHAQNGSGFVLGLAIAGYVGSGKDFNKGIDDVHMYLGMSG